GREVAVLLPLGGVGETDRLPVELEPHRVHLDPAIRADRGEVAVQGLLQQVPVAGRDGGPGDELRHDSSLVTPPGSQSACTLAGRPQAASGPAARGAPRAAGLQVARYPAGQLRPVTLRTWPGWAAVAVL